MPDVLVVCLAVVYVVGGIGYRLGAWDRWLDPGRKGRPRAPRYRLPEEQIDREFPERHRDEARAIIDAVATYVPPTQRNEVLFRLLTEARGSVRRLSAAAVSELAVLPDGTRVPLLARARRR